MQPDFSYLKNINPVSLSLVSSVPLPPVINGTKDIDTLLSLKQIYSKTSVIQISAIVYE